MPAPTASNMVDRVDDADRPMGTVRRDRVFLDHAGFRVVHIFVFDPHGSLLLQRLSSKRERNPLKWGSSVAGYVRVGEDYADAAQRRLREELGLVADVAKFGNTVMFDQGARKFISLFLASARSSDLAIAEPDHIDKIEFVPLQDIANALRLKPTEFTETFLFVFRFFQETLRLTGPDGWVKWTGPASVREAL